MITFPIDGPFRQIVYKQIIDDRVAQEADEVVTVTLTIQSPKSGVMFSYFRTTRVRIVDNEGKLSILISQSFEVVLTVLFCVV